MSVQLDLLRHGETELGGGLRGSLDDALTPLGWAQMREAVKGGGPWDRIVSSPLQRCALFARELSAQLDIPVSFDKHLQELHFGAWEGQSAAALMQTDEQALGQFWADPYAFTPPDGEPVLEFSARVVSAVGRLQQDFAAIQLDLSLRCIEVNIQRGAGVHLQLRAVLQAQRAALPAAGA